MYKVLPGGDLHEVARHNMDNIIGDNLDVDPATGLGVCLERWLPVVVAAMVGAVTLVL